jgi:hypothetical protein
MPIYRRSYVLRLGSDPVCYLWTGVARLETPSDSIDPAGALWEGVAGIIEIPALKALINGIAERVRFVLSGVTSETLRLAIADRETVSGADLRIGHVDFDADWQIDGAINWEWLGIADVLVIERPRGDGQGATRTISLSVASADTLRANPRPAFYTDADQSKQSPTDEFCSQVASITRGLTRRFGPK